MALAVAKMLLVYEDRGVSAACGNSNGANGRDSAGSENAAENAAVPLTKDGYPDLNQLLGMNVEDAQKSLGQQYFEISESGGVSYYGSSENAFESPQPSYAKAGEWAVGLHPSDENGEVDEVYFYTTFSGSDIETATKLMLANFNLEKNSGSSTEPMPSGTLILGVHGNDGAVIGSLVIASDRNGTIHLSVSLERS